MRLHRLEIVGFGPFRRAQTIDFDAFADDGLFLIAGRTGAGKSSILDAVTFALYGSIPRYAAGEKRLRSDHSAPDEPSRVVLEFSSSAGRYRIERSPEYERPAKRGGGFTKQAAEVVLFRWEDDDWRGLGARQKDVDGELLPTILQLTKDQFLQVILLAQNRFARFLLAKNDERRAVLRTLFGSQRFDAYATELDSRRRESEAKLSSGATVLAARLDEAEQLVADHGLCEEGEPDAPAAAAERVERLRATSVRLADRLRGHREALAVADAAYAAAAGELETARRHQRLQTEREETRRALAELEETEPAIVLRRRELDDAVRAESIRASFEAWERAAASQSAADEALIAAHARWRSASGADDTDVDDPSRRAAELRTDAERLAAQGGALAAAIVLEHDAPQRESELRAGGAAVASAESVVAELDERLGVLPDLLAAVEERRSASAPEAARVDERAETVVEAQTGLRAAKHAETVAQASATADIARVAAAEGLQRASERVASFFRRRLSGYAGELAAELEDGVACAVCGSFEHPAPASAPDDPISPEDIEQAEAQQRAAAAHDRETATSATYQRSLLTEALAAAAGRSVADWEATLRDGEELLARARGARAALDAATTERDALLVEQDGIAARRAEASASLASAREALAVTQERCADAAALVQAARGDEESVAARAAVIESRRVASTAYAEALDRLATVAETLRATRADVDRLLLGAGFDDDSAARAALRSDDERARIAAAVAAHENGIRTHRATLERLAVEGVPEAPIETAVAEVAAAAAAERRGAVQKAVSTDEVLTGQLERLVALAAEAERGLGEQTRRHEVLARLADTVSGREPNTYRMALETFVLAAELEQIVTAANLRLADMSSGRYRLVHSDERAARGAASGLGLEIFDAHTGRHRPASSLSGGETFLASLSLALGLAEVVTARAGGVQLHTLFIDEGFGSLDAETLDVAMRTLDELRVGGRTVGVISHVEAMQEQIPARLQVRVAIDGSSDVV